MLAAELLQLRNSHRLVVQLPNCRQEQGLRLAPKQPPEPGQPSIRSC